MSEKFYIARDGEQNSDWLGDLFLYSQKPDWDDSEHYWFADFSMCLGEELFPEIKNGECKCFELVEVEEK